MEKICYFQKALDGCYDECYIGRVREMRHAGSFAPLASLLRATVFTLLILMQLGWEIGLEESRCSGYLSVGERASLCEVA